MKTTLVRVGYLPTCPHCKPFMRDLIFHYRTEDDVFFYFLPYRAAPTYDDAREYALSYIPLMATQQARTYLVNVVPHVVVRDTLLVPKSGIPSNVAPYSYHPSTLMPFLRRIKRRMPYDFSPIDQRFYKEYQNFVATLLGKKISSLAKK